jgi:hypothetical protein
VSQSPTSSCENSTFSRVVFARSSRTIRSASRPSAHVPDRPVDNNHLAAEARPGRTPASEGGRDSLSHGRRVGSGHREAMGVEGCRGGAGRRECVRVLVDIVGAARDVGPQHHGRVGPQQSAASWRLLPKCLVPGAWNLLTNQHQPLWLRLDDSFDAWQLQVGPAA